MSAVYEIAEIRDLLDSDLYSPCEPSDPEEWAQAMRSPLGWRVEWALRRRDGSTPGPGARVALRVVDPRGKEYARAEDASAAWLSGVLP